MSRVPKSKRGKYGGKARRRAYIDGAGSLTSNTPNSDQAFAALDDADEFFVLRSDGRT